MFKILFEELRLLFIKDDHRCSGFKIYPDGKLCKGCRDCMGRNKFSMYKRG